MKFYSTLALLLILSYSTSYNQTPTVHDCPGAIHICQDYYDEPDSFACSNGNYFDEIGLFEVTCTTPEFQGIWYSFTVQSSGVLRFTLKTHKPDVDYHHWIVVDYDWILFDITNGNCADLRTSPLTYTVSSNTYGAEIDTLWNDTTGINSAYVGGELSNCNGPGFNNGPPFNQDLQVIAGNNYLLYISNPYNSHYGYSLDFSASTAVIYDDTPPELKDCKPKCGESSLLVVFSENIQCNSLSSDMFRLSGPEGDIKIINVNSTYCKAGAESDKEILIMTKTDFVPGDYVLSLINPVYDACGNISDPDSIEFNIPGTEILSVNYTDILCYGAHNGSISINAVSESDTILYSVFSGYTYQINDEEFDSLGPGNYKIVVSNEYDCRTEGETVTLTNPDDIVLTVENVVNVDICAGIETGEIAVSAAGGTGNITYSINGSEYMGDPVFSGLMSGEHAIYARDENNCEKSVNVEIEFILNNCLSIPNVFTPNDDGINDTWEIGHIDMFPEATIEIYDRWGKLLASYKGDDPGWDGRFNGNKMPADTYYYFVSTGMGEPAKGQVTIIR